MNVPALIIDQLRAAFHHVAIDTTGDMPVLTVDKSQLIQMVTTLVQNPQFRFQFLTDLCGVHYPDMTPPSLALVLHLHNLEDNVRLRVKSFTPVSDPTFSSLTGLFAAANWMERETYDFFGIQFLNHPDLTRILNMDDMVDFPMRKEFTLEDPTRTDKEDVYFGR